MALNYPKTNRMYTDAENMNKRLYRESEQHVKLKKDGEYVRNDLGFDQ